MANRQHSLAGHFGTSWVKHYCTYQRDSKQITMVPFDQKSGGKGVSSLWQFLAWFAWPTGNAHNTRLQVQSCAVKLVNSAVIPGGSFP